MHAKIDSDDQATTGDKSTRCWSTGNGDGARWWDNGARIDRGKLLDWRTGTPSSEPNAGVRAKISAIFPVYASRGITIAK